VPFRQSKGREYNYASDGGEDLKRTFASSGEPWHPMISTPENAAHLSVYENWQLNLEKDEVANAWLKAWNASGGLYLEQSHITRLNDLRYLPASLTSTGQPFDGLVLPPSANVAHEHGKWPR